MSQGGNDGRDGGEAGPKAEDDVLASIRRIVGEEGDAAAAPAGPAARRPGGDAPDGEAAAGAGDASPGGSWPAPSGGRRDGVLPLARAMRIEAGERGHPGAEGEDDAPLMLSAGMRADGGPFPTSEAAAPPAAPGGAPEGDAAPVDDDADASARLRDAAAAATPDEPSDRFVADEAGAAEGGRATPSLRLDAGPAGDGADNVRDDEDRAGGRTGGDAAAMSGAATAAAGVAPGSVAVGGSQGPAEGTGGPPRSDPAFAPAPASDASTPPRPAAPPASAAPAPAAASAPPPSGRDLRQAMATPPAARAGSGGLPRDGEALEALIRRILRDELSGEMGERVSRNIKLLVEREVRRAVEQLAAEADAGD